MRKIIPALLASALSSAYALAAAGTAFAGDPAATGKHAQARQHFFDQLDTNHDGVVSRAEYQAWVDERFARFDSNRDGSVDATEIETSPATAARVQKRAEGFVKRYDRSGSGKVSQADFEAREMNRFDRLSGGADTLTPEQLAAHRHGPMHRHAAHDGADTDSSGD